MLLATTKNFQKEFYCQQRRTMAENQTDPESFGAGPLNVAPASFSRIHRDRQSFRWSRVTLSHESITPPPRSGAASVVVQGKLYMFGVSQSLIWSDNKRTTKPIPVLKWIAHYFLPIFIKGYGGGTGRLDDFYSFDFDTSTWENVKVVGDEKPGCRENNGVVISDSSRSIYLFGGYNGSSWLNDLWKVSVRMHQCMSR